MEFLVSELIGEVRVVLDRDNASPSLLGGEEDALSMDSIIESRLVPAATYLMMRAPLALIDNARSLTAAPAIGVDGVGVLPLPEDFLRLKDFRMRSWEGAVTVMDEQDPRYAQQRSRYGGVRGHAQAPVVAVVSRGGKWWLELYSCAAGDVVASGSYVALPQVSDGKLDVSLRLKDTMVCYAAYLTCLSMGDTETASRLLSPVQAVIG